MKFSKNDVESFNFLGTIVENANWMSKKEKRKLLALHKVATNDIKRIQKGGKKRRRSKSGGGKKNGETCEKNSDCDSGICDDDINGIKRCQSSSGASKGGEDGVPPQDVLRQLAGAAVSVVGTITPQVTPAELRRHGVPQPTQENADTTNNTATNVRNMVVMLHQNSGQPPASQQVATTERERMLRMMVTSRDSQLAREHERDMRNHEFQMAQLNAAAKFGHEQIAANERMRLAEIESNRATNQGIIRAGEHKVDVENIDRTSAANFRFGTNVVLGSLTVLLAWLTYGSTDSVLGIFNQLHGAVSMALPQIPTFSLEDLSGIWWAIGGLFNVLPLIVNWTTAMIQFFLTFFTSILAALASLGTWGPVVAIVLAGLILTMVAQILLRVGNFSLMIPGVYLRLGMGDQAPHAASGTQHPMLQLSNAPLPALRDGIENIRNGIEDGRPIQPDLDNADRTFQALLDIASGNAPQANTQQPLLIGNGPQPQATTQPLLMGNGPQPQANTQQPLLMGNGQQPPPVVVPTPAVVPPQTTAQLQEEKHSGLEGGRKKKRRTYRKGKNTKKTKKKKKIARRQSKRKKLRRKSRR